MASQVWNVPNILTMMRLVLSAVLFAMIALGPQYMTVALAVFIITALTDFVDGWWARRFNQCTQLGRILDPFADKILICGTFIFLSARPEMQADWKLFQPWMAVVIMGREMLVTAIRGYMEQHGVNFAAKWAGKIKMGFQCVACVAACLYLSFADGSGNAVTNAPEWLYWAVVVSVWVTIFSTLQSGLGYVLTAIRIRPGK
ncbi:MAG: CDP-diacylglycerol--glycerol-3-phosphate 3-phosphatidyltransferase [Planctomycetia bacterium]|nr:CDP-diacylglycerol--glycerol-3-phosphate 3-phosphatidyltransferase [Planctomycetia bacterium]